VGVCVYRLLTLTEPFCGLCTAPYERSVVGKFGEFFRCPRYQRRCRNAATLSLAVYRNGFITQSHQRLREVSRRLQRNTSQRSQLTMEVKSEPPPESNADSNAAESPVADTEKKPRTHSHSHSYSHSLHSHSHSHCDTE
jgi:hypothetical protein